MDSYDILNCILFYSQKDVRKVTTLRLPWDFYRFLWDFHIFLWNLHTTVWQAHACESLTQPKNR